MRLKQLLLFTIFLLPLYGCENNNDYIIRKLNKHSNIKIKDNILYESIEKERIFNSITETENLFNQLFPEKLTFSIELVFQESTDAKIKITDGEIGILLNYKIVQNYDKISLGVLLVHEMFHVYQFRNHSVLQWKNKMLKMLYIESSAVLVSSLVYPGLPDWKYISPWQNDDTEYKKFLKYDKDASKELKENLYVNDQVIFDRFFSGNPIASEQWAPRMGYYLGFNIMKKFYSEVDDLSIFFLDETEFENLISQ